MSVKLPGKVVSARKSHKIVKIIAFDTFKVTDTVLTVATALKGQIFSQRNKKKKCMSEVTYFSLSTTSAQTAAHPRFHGIVPRSYYFNR